MIDDPAQDRRNPISGNPDALEGEINRYRDLSERCRQAEHEIQKLRLGRWVGTAAEGFGIRRELLRQQWAIARIAFRDCADALDRYRQTLITVQSLARTATLDEDLERWRAQKSEQAARTTIELRDAFHRLLSLAPLVNGQLAGVAPALAPSHPSPSPDPKTARKRSDDSTRSEDQSPRMLQLRIRALCTAVLDADYVSAEHLARRRHAS
jgi:Putative T7SS secretion signal domain